MFNLYSAGLSLSNMFERLGRFWTTLVASVLGVALCGDPDVLNFFRYVSMFGNVFSPVAGVLVFDYLFVRRMRIDHPAQAVVDGKKPDRQGLPLVRRQRARAHIAQRIALYGNHSPAGAAKAGVDAENANRSLHAGR